MGLWRKLFIVIGAVLGVFLMLFVYVLYEGANYYSPIRDHEYVKGVERNYLEIGWVTGVVEACTKEPTAGAPNADLSILRLTDRILKAGLQHPKFVAVSSYWASRYAKRQVEKGQIHCDTPGNTGIAWREQLNRMLSNGWAAHSGEAITRPSEMFNVSLQVGHVSGWADACNVLDESRKQHADGVMEHVTWLAKTPKRIAMAYAIERGAFAEAFDHVEAKRLSCQDAGKAADEIKSYEGMLPLRYLMGFAP